jgi:uncharacterized membrane-anchored protein
MSTTTRQAAAYNRVPKVTVNFWLIKVMVVTVGKTAADYLALDLGYGLAVTSLIMTALLAVALVLQFTQRRYLPWAYWLAVVLISIVGTLITDNLVNNFEVKLETITIGFSLALIVTFAVWYGFERTLSIQTIFTTRREASTGLRSCSPSRLERQRATGSWRRSESAISKPALCSLPSLR